MAQMSTEERREGLIVLSRELGREDRRMAILGEGNASTRVEGGFLVKASGRTLATLTEEGVVACRAEGLLALIERGTASDEEAERALLASRVDDEAAKPSVEALFHAWLLGRRGVEWVAHVHPVAVNGVLCSGRGREFAAGRIFPDEVVCCGEESAFVPYTDPGLGLAVAIKGAVEEFEGKWGKPPRVVLLENHGAITLGATANAALGVMLMLEKAAEIWLGAASGGGPAYLRAEDVRRIAGRADEHYRQRVLNL